MSVSESAPARIVTSQAETRLPDRIGGVAIDAVLVWPPLVAPVKRTP